MKKVKEIVLRAEVPCAVIEEMGGEWHSFAKWLNEQPECTKYRPFSRDVLVVEVTDKRIALQFAKRYLGKLKRAMKGGVQMISVVQQINIIQSFIDAAERKRK